MSETLTTEQTTHRPHEVTVQGNNLQNAMWGIEEETKEETTTTEQATEQKTETTTEEPKVETAAVVEEKKEEYDIVDANQYVKDAFGWDNIEVGKKEVEELRQRVKDLDITDEQSRKVLSLIKNGETKKLYQFLHEQEQIERLTTSDLSSKEVAAELVKFGIANKNKNLTQDEVEFLFNERFSVPSKPVRDDSDLDEEYNAKVDTWKRQVENIEKRLVIEAKLVQPDLEQLKAKLVLPDIKFQEQSRQPTQEELDAARRFEESYLSSVNSSLKEFSGFSVKVKNEAVGLPEITIPYVAVETEKTLLSNEMVDFAKNGYNTNTLFASEWMNEDGSINTKRVAEDRYLLKNRDRILNKLAEEAANKAVDAYIKGKKNIDIRETSQQGTAVITKEDKTGLDEIRDSFFS